MGYQNISLERRMKVIEWLETEPAERMNEPDFRRSLHLSPSSFRLIKAQWHIDNELAKVDLLVVKRKKEVRRNARGRGGGKDYHQTEVLLGEPLSYDSIAFLKTRTREADEALILAVNAGNPTAQKIYRQVIGQLVEKAETTHIFEVSADEHIRIAREADKRISELSGAADGTQGLQPKSSLLPEKIRPGSGPD